MKDRFRNPDRWSEGAIEAGRRTIFEGTWAILRLFAPFLPFVTEELYEHAIKPRLGEGAPSSLHVAPWPADEKTGAIDCCGGARDEAAEAAGELLIDLVGGVRQLKTMGQMGLGTPLSRITITCEESRRAAIEAVARDWLAAARAGRYEFVSEGPEHAGGNRGISLAVEKAENPA